MPTNTPVTDTTHDAANRIVLADYTPAWVARFEAERDALAAALAPHVVAIEHIGSTSVPGLAAKPIIDIALVLRTLAVIPDLRPRLLALGYLYRGEGGIALRPFFRKPLQVRHLADRLVHLHVTAPGNRDFRAHVRFRDYLRAHPEARDEYAAIKRAAAEQVGDDLDAYTELKGGFIRRCLEAAASR